MAAGKSADRAHGCRGPLTADSPPVSFLTQRVPPPTIYLAPSHWKSCSCGEVGLGRPLLLNLQRQVRDL
jgi:hypothetical protein